jgi:type I site-specific restriction endonuclease
LGYLLTNMAALSPSGLPVLNFPAYEFRIREEKGQLKIFDLVRKKYVALTPEEWVRQHLIHYLNKDKGYPLSLMMVEKEFKYNSLSKRADIVVCDRNGKPLLMTECKSPDVEITQSVFDQAMRYNLKMDVTIMLLTNGLKHFCFRLDKANRKYVALTEIPLWGNEEQRVGSK